MAYMLRASGLSVSFIKDRPAINNVSLTLCRGERIAIVGPNGSGKTTLLRALSGRFPALNSRIFLGDRPFSHLTRQQIAQSIACVAQNDMPDLRLLVYDYVSLGQIPHAGRNDRKTQRQSIERAMHEAGIVEFSDRELGTLSGGQMQRVLLARALAQAPEILLLDEPTNHLDLRARSDILNLVRQSSAAITLTVLHDLSLVPECADRVLVMHRGRLVSAGTVEKTLTDSLLNDVFAMKRLILKHPETHRPIWVFEPARS